MQSYSHIGGREAGRQSYGHIDRHTATGRQGKNQEDNTSCQAARKAARQEARQAGR